MRKEKLKRKLFLSPVQLKDTVRILVFYNNGISPLGLRSLKVELNLANPNHVYNEDNKNAPSKNFLQLEDGK